MKKILLACVLAGIVSCSNENVSQDDQNVIEMQSKQKTVVEDQLDEFFSRYYTSEEFTNYYSSLKVFYTKLSYDWSPEELKTDEEVFNWFRLNLKKTKFGSVDEARTSYINMNTLLVNLDTKFPEYDEIILSNPIEVLSNKIGKWFPFENIPDSTLGKCESDYQGCRKTASDNYATKAKVLADIKNETGRVDLGERNRAMDDYNTEIDNCLSTYRQCTGVE